MSGVVPDATVARLPLYLRALVQLAERGVDTVSSEGLAQASGVTSAQVRKDLSFLGSYGTRGVGYRVEELLDHIAGFLGLNRDRPTVLVGVGNLGRALASYEGFAERGFQLIGLFDADPGKVGSQVGGLVVRSLEELDDLVAREGVRIAVVTVPVSAAQVVVDRLVSAGISAVLNFAPCHVEVPPHVRVRRVDLSTELQILAYYEQQRSAEVALHGVVPGAAREARRATGA